MPGAVTAQPAVEADDGDNPKKKLMRAIAVGLYIVCILPLMILDGHILGFCGTLVIVAIATVMIILGGKKENKEIQDEVEKNSRSPLQKSISSMLWTVGLAVYILWSFTTYDWDITWVVFPILAALDSLLIVLVKLKNQQSAVLLPCTTDKPDRKNIKKWIWGIGIFFFVILSLRTQAWGATWLLLPITATAEQLAYAIMDYKEVLEHET